MKRRLSAAALTWILLLLFPVCISAQVNTVKEPTAGNSIYIAGNPDLYPFEYYDSSSKRYLGILPELYTRLSEETGITFSYISAGKENRQQQIAKNNQAELISAHLAGEIENLREDYPLLSFTSDGKEQTVCIGFTGIASQQLIDRLLEELERIDNSVLLSITLAQTASFRSEFPIHLLVALCLLLALAVAVLTILLIQKRRAEGRRRRDQLIDPLTGIGNEEYYRYSFDHYLSPASRSLYYVAYISLEIRRIEEYVGSAEAEELQRYTADILSSSASDYDFTARITDGVFAYTFQCPSREQAEIRISELLERLNEGEKTLLEEYREQFRAGLFSLETANTPCETALNHARQGYLYAVQNKMSYCFSDDRILNREAQKKRLQKKISDAVSNHEFKLYLQFVVKSKTGKICGAEALSRWQNPEEGLLTPDRYIETMQNAGIIDRLDFYILEEACRQLEAWKTTDKKELWISCNFTRITVSSTDFLQRFREITEKYRFDHSNLILELTEDSLSDNHTAAYLNILACKKEGYRIALDDFGSGYTSFSDLCDYPIDLIKVDRHIIAKATTERGSVLLNGICKLARYLDVLVLCEGVETAEENAVVQTVNCDFVQGYFYSRSYPLYEALEYCSKQLHEYERADTEKK